MKKIGDGIYLKLILKLTSANLTQLPVNLFNMNFFVVLSTFLSFASCNHSETIDFPSINPNIHVWVFLDVDCPVSQFYTNVLNEYQQEFKNDSVLFYAVFPHLEDNDEAIQAFVNKYDFKVNIVGDPDLKFTRKFDAKATPEAFITRGDSILYRGVIDNSFVAVGERRCGTDQFYLRYALKQLTSSNQKFVTRTKPVGCTIGR